MTLKRFPGSATTAYRDLIEKTQDAVFKGQFSEDGSFQKKTIDGRLYWYWRGKDRVEKYVGPDSPELLSRIENHKALRDEERTRRSIVGMLARIGYPKPPAEIGEVLKALSRAGFFRRRACVVGTHAFGAYAGLLGIRIPGSALATQDLDLAQFKAISVAVAEVERIDLLAEIRKADPSYRPVSRGLQNARPYTFVNKAKYKVEILTANRGPDDDAPAKLPSVGTYAHQFRFLDFLIYDPVAAVLLHSDGVLVNVPSPERFAIHKLIVAHRRTKDPLKAAKDIEQSGLLIEALAEFQFDDLAFALKEALDRGPSWRAAIERSLPKLRLPSALKTRLESIVVA